MMISMIIIRKIVIITLIAMVLIITKNNTYICNDDDNNNNNNNVDVKHIRFYNYNIWLKKKFSWVCVYKTLAFSNTIFLTQF